MRDSDRLKRRAAIPAPRHDDTPLDDDVAIAPIDLRRMVRIVRRHLRLVLLVAFLTAGAAVAYALLRAPSYRATAVIRLHDARSQLSGGLAGNRPDEALGGPTVNPLLSLVELLSSRTMAGTVVDSVPVLRIRVEEIPLREIESVSVAEDQGTDSMSLEFSRLGVREAGAADSAMVPYGEPVGHRSFRVTFRRPPDQPTGRIFLQSRDEAIRGLLASLKVRPRENTDVVDVEYSAPDSTMARSVANRLVSVFQSANAYSAQAESRSRRQFVESQLKEATTGLVDARAALADFRANQRSFSARDRFSSQQARAAAVQGQRSTLAAERQLYQSMLERLHGNAPADGAAIMALLTTPGLEDKPLIRQIAEQLVRYQAQRDSLTSGPYGSAATNPDVTRLTALITSTQQRLAAAVQSNVDVLGQQVAALDSERTRVAPAYQRLSVNESDESALQEAVTAAGRRVDQLQEQYQNARLAEAVGVGQVEVVDLAGPPIPAGLSKPVLVLGGLLFGLMCGILLAFTAEYARPTIWRQQDLALVLESPNPVVVPRFERVRLRNGAARAAHQLGDGTSLVMLREPGGGSAEAVRALRTKLIFSTDWSALKSLLVTSAVENEGKSTVAANLAAAFAQQGVRTILIDADMRQPTLHRQFAIMREPGLSSVLNEDIELDAAIQESAVPNLWLIPAGKVPDNPAETLGRPVLKKVLEALRQRFEVVILDSPPLLAVSDASIIAATTDGVLMVVRAGRAMRETVSAARDQLADVQAQLVGAVLNDPDGEVTRGGEGYYFYGYHGAGGHAARN